LPKAVLDPELEPTFPVSCERPVFPTAPTDEKRTKFAAVPKLIVCPKFAFGIKNRKAADNVISNFVFILFIL